MIGELLSRKSIKKLGNEYLSKIRNSSEQLEQEVSNSEETLLISSEAFQNCDPRIVREYFRNYDVTVVVYLREQASYLISAYAQKVHATNYAGTLDTFYKDVFASDYFAFLEKWRDVFESRLIVNIFDRKYLARKDIVYDFCCGILNIPEPLVSTNYHEQNANPTLTRRLLAYKTILNKQHIDPSHTSALYRGLSELSKSDDSGPLIMSDKMLATVRHDCAPGNSKVAREYFDRTQLFDNKELTSCSKSPTPITEIEFSDISAQLITMHPQLSEILRGHHPALLQTSSSI